MITHASPANLKLTFGLGAVAADFVVDVILVSSNFDLKFSLVLAESSMKFDPKHATANEIYAMMIRAITPRPIAWVSTRSLAGVSNLAPFSYFNGVCSAPPAPVDFAGQSS